MMTADHGMSEVDPKMTVFLTTDKRFVGVERFFKSNRRGELLFPAGTARDKFLYVKDELLDAVQEFLQARPAGEAEVGKVCDLMAKGYFGLIFSPKFRARVGNPVILSHRYESVWWYVKDKFGEKYYGHDRGLASQEMEIPLFTYLV